MKREPRLRAPNDPEGFDPVAADSSGLCRGCWFFEEQYQRGLPCDCNDLKNFSCDPGDRPDGLKVIFVKKKLYGNEEE